MKGMTPRRMAQVSGGILHVREGFERLASQEVDSIVTDSRKAEPGCLFAAIVGGRTDGNQYIPQVLEKGAVCILTEKELPGDLAPCWIRVSDTQRALGDIAQEYRQCLGTPVIGITGSVGKTSTKEMIASVLSQKYLVWKTPGNFNNELGVPLSIFGLREQHEAAVLEMGMNHFGEMHHLAQIARPDICVLTNIGESHLEFMGDRDGVLRAKSEIFDYLKEDAHILLNGNDDKLVSLKMVKGIRPAFFGIPGQGIREKEDSSLPELSWYADEICSHGLEGTSCRIHTPSGDFSVTVPIPGEHMVMNALSAAAAGQVLGLSLEQIRRGIETVTAADGRMKVLRTGRYTVIDDGYNANPVSMKAALKVLRDTPGVRTAILGDMFELGENSEAYHAEVGSYAALCALTRLIAIGPQAKLLAGRAAEENPDMDIRYYPDVDAFLEEMDTVLPPEGTVLVKASHGMGFARIVEKLQ